jgi:4-hydroxybenzoate polyprenyltransferase
VVWRLSGTGALFGAGVVAMIAGLVYQHTIVKPTDLSRVDAAFFTTNGAVSVILAACGIASVLLGL